MQDNISGFLDTTLLDSYLFEWAGLEIGFKEAAIFYPRLHQVAVFEQMLTAKQLCWEKADFSYTRENKMTKKASDIGPNSMLCYYVSKHKDAAGLLKSLDSYHQNQATPLHMSKKDLLMEFGRLLGYPPCCSEFLYALHHNPENAGLMEGYKQFYDEDTLYPMAALHQSKEVLHLLNNFSLHTPRLIPFSVCSYHCVHALALAKKTLSFARSPDTVLRQLKVPFVFFNPDEQLRFLRAKSDGDSVHYTVDSKSATTPFLNSVLALFEKGDNFIITGDKIFIKEGKKVMEMYQKRHRYDGIFVNPT